jgi:hypothetical protein
MSTSSLFCAHATLRGCGSCSFSLLAFRADTKTRRTTTMTALRRSGSNDALCNTPRGSRSKIPEKTVELLSRSLVEQRRTAINKRKASELGEERDGGEKSKQHVVNKGGASAPLVVLLWVCCVLGEIPEMTHAACAKPTSLPPKKHAPGGYNSDTFVGPAQLTRGLSSSAAKPAPLPGPSPHRPARPPPPPVDPPDRRRVLESVGRDPADEQPAAVSLDSGGRKLLTHIFNVQCFAHAAAACSGYNSYSSCTATCGTGVQYKSRNNYVAR